MENLIIIADSVKNQIVSTKEVISSMEVGDYFMLDNSWIKITENHVLMAKGIF
jgi:hypothetical protein